MAIPFNVDADRESDEVILQQLLGELCQTLRQIRLVQGSIRNPQINNVRARDTWNQLVMELSANTVGIEHRFPDFGVNVALSLSPFASQNDLETSTPSNTASSGENGNRRRSPVSPCYDEPKPVKVSVSVEVANEWSKQEKPAPKENNTGPRSLLSKLAPTQPFGGPIWTAVICVVGWHLLRAR